MYWLNPPEKKRKGVTPSTVTGIGSAARIRSIKRQRYEEIEKLLRDWKPIDLFAEYEKEIDELKATLDELIEAYEMMSLTDAHQKEFNDVLHKAKKLIDY